MGDREIVQGVMMSPWRWIAMIATLLELKKRQTEISHPLYVKEMLTVLKSVGQKGNV